ncbi:hypothetical protein MP228_007259 [Amoeboaphelidium protococcarum]|nr:hypothetical protein MP228_007259 [Amoeboaphelidium protococcarum]
MSYQARSKFLTKTGSTTSLRKLNNLDIVDNNSKTINVSLCAGTCFWIPNKQHGYSLARFTDDQGDTLKRDKYKVSSSDLLSVTVFEIDHLIDSFLQQQTIVDGSLLFQDANVNASDIQRAAVEVQQVYNPLFDQDDDFSAETIRDQLLQRRLQTPWKRCNNDADVLCLYKEQVMFGKQQISQQMEAFVNLDVNLSGVKGDDQRTASNNDLSSRSAVVMGINDQKNYQIAAARIKQAELICESAYGLLRMFTTQAMGVGGNGDAASRLLAVEIFDSSQPNPFKILSLSKSCISLSALRQHLSFWIFNALSYAVCNPSRAKLFNFLPLQTAAVCSSIFGTSLSQSGGEQYAQFEQQIHQLQLKNEQVTIVLKLLTAVVLISAVEFKENQDQSAESTQSIQIASDRNVIDTASQLLGLEFSALEMILLCQFSSVGDQSPARSGFKAQRVLECQSSRDQFCRYLYQKVVEQVVWQINECINTSKSQQQAQSSSHVKVISIPAFQLGVGDFDSFIFNYVNEKVHHHFLATNAVGHFNIFESNNSIVHGINNIENGNQIVKNLADNLNVVSGGRTSIFSQIDDTLKMPDYPNDTNLTMNIHRTFQGVTKTLPDFVQNFQDPTNDQIRRLYQQYLRCRHEEGFIVRHFDSEAICLYRTQGFSEFNAENLEGAFDEYLLKNVPKLSQDSAIHSIIAQLKINSSQEPSYVKSPSGTSRINFHLSPLQSKTGSQFTVPKQGRSITSVCSRVKKECIGLLKMLQDGQYRVVYDVECLLVRHINDNGGAQQFIDGSKMLLQLKMWNLIQLSQLQQFRFGYEFSIAPLLNRFKPFMKDLRLSIDLQNPNSFCLAVLDVLGVDHRRGVAYVSSSLRILLSNSVAELKQSDIEILSGSASAEVYQQLSNRVVSALFRVKWHQYYCIALVLVRLKSSAVKKPSTQLQEATQLTRPLSMFDMLSNLKVSHSMKQLHGSQASLSRIPHSSSKQNLIAVLNGQQSELSPIVQDLPNKSISEHVEQHRLVKTQSVQSIGSIKSKIDDGDKQQRTSQMHNLVRQSQPQLTGVHQIQQSLVMGDQNGQRPISTSSKMIAHLSQQINIKSSDSSRHNSADVLDILGNYTYNATTSIVYSQDQSSPLSQSYVVDYYQQQLPHSEQTSPQLLKKLSGPDTQQQVPDQKQPETVKPLDRLKLIVAKLKELVQTQPNADAQIAKLKDEYLSVCRDVEKEELDKSISGLTENVYIKVPTGTGDGIISVEYQFDSDSKQWYVSRQIIERKQSIMSSKYVLVQSLKSVKALVNNLKDDEKQNVLKQMKNVIDSGLMVVDESLKFMLKGQHSVFTSLIDVGMLSEDLDIAKFNAQWNQIINAPQQ